LVEKLLKGIFTRKLYDDQVTPLSVILQAPYRLPAGAHYSGADPVKDPSRPLAVGPIVVLAAWN
jgi:hypothetical protein